MSQSSYRKKLAELGIQESEEEIKKRNDNYRRQIMMSKVWKKAHRIIRGSFDPKTKEIHHR